MSRYIDANMAIYQLSKWAMLDSQPRAFKRCINYLNTFADKQPADVQEVKHGKWINTNHGGIHGDYIYRCSVCENERESYIEEERYCPNCGAKMDLEDKS